MTFEDLKLAPEILDAVKRAKYDVPTPIQERAIPLVLEGRDIFGCAQTGTGKTAAFVLPIIQKFMSGKLPEGGKFRAMILVPTRELAEQVNDNIAIYAKYTKTSHAKVYGGVSPRPQVRALENGVEILVATPGRLLDLFNQKKFSFDGVEIAVLDEADRMLDMGFIRDIKKIFSKLPKGRQTLLFSATLTDAVKDLARALVRNPAEISVTPDKPAVEKIDQKLFFVNEEDKVPLLKYLVDERTADDPSTRALVFCRTKHGANKVAKKLSAEKYGAEAIHGNKSQSARQRALDNFKSGRCKVLVATDIAARGIDVKDMKLVVNYDLPEEAETYVHRIGRTARAQQSGEAISFFSQSDWTLLKAVERFIKKTIQPAKEENPFESTDARDVHDGRKKGSPRKRGGNRGARDAKEVNDGEDGQRRTNTPHRPRKNFGRRSGKPSGNERASDMDRRGKMRLPGNFSKSRGNRRNRGGR